MAKGHKSRRDPSAITNRPVSFQRSIEPDGLLSLLSPSVRATYKDVEDGRLFHPDPDDFSPRSFSSRPARINVDQPRRRSATGKSSGMAARSAQTFSFGAKPYYSFRYPKTVLVCVRRKIREAVLHALGFTGKGAGRRRKARRTASSNVHC